MPVTYLGETIVRHPLDHAILSMPKDELSAKKVVM
jgi:hypothetical protein